MSIVLGSTTDSPAQLENRTPTGGASIITRKCIGGTNAGVKCKGDSECTSNECFAFNIVNLTVNMKTAAGAGWTPTAAEMTAIRTNFTAVNDAVADISDGQIVLGTLALVVDNGAPNAVVQLTAGACRTGGGVCTQNSDCAAGDPCNLGGGTTSTGGWGSNGTMRIGIGCIQNPLCFAHEFIHLFGNARDEYEGALDDGIDNDGNGQIDECGENQGQSRCFGGADDGDNCDATACTLPGTCRRIVCLDGGPPAAPTSVPGCLMQCCLANTDSELCVPANHDPNFDTEQSQCRSNNSCWTQLALEWPSVITAPAGLPDPGPTTAPRAVTFIEPAILDRFVAVIDRSASMNAESPTRIQLAVNAVKDFVDLLSNGSEFGLASFASADEGSPSGVDSTKDFPASAGLQPISGDADRTAAKASADGVLGRASGFTRIGAGLRQARDMFLESGGEITINSTVLLLTDGINNRPTSDPQGDLDSALQELADAGLQVFVSCIGEARDSVQCSNIADRTAGRFVDSATTANLYDAFVEFVAKAERNGISRSQMNTPIAQGELSGAVPVVIEPGAQQARFVASWTEPSSDLDLQLFRPDGTQVPMSSRVIGTQGEFYRIDTPPEGTWTMRVQGTSVPGPERFSARAIVDHKALNFDAGLARSAIAWPDAFLINAHPSLVGSIEGCHAEATVQKPDGSSELVELPDDGGPGDGDAHDGLHSLQYRNFTAGDGIYTFNVRVRCEEGVAEIHHHDDPGIGDFPFTPLVPTFERTLRFSGTVTGVPDNLPPVADICRDVRAECEGPTTAVALDGTCSFDPEGSPLTYHWSSPTGLFMPDNAPKPTAFFPLGRNRISLQVADADGATSSPDSGLVVVADTTAPEIRSLTASPDVLWPPSHKMVPVALTVDVVDVCDPGAPCEITEVTSNEPINGSGDGNTEPDWEVTGPLSLNLRAERAGGGNGRVYSVHVVCSDASQNEASATVTVEVPHDRRP